ncbi:YitT family protein [Lactobacillus sp. CBA3606]|uniref:YczE/YyaS/YitT family protein n=1 Tax=Lactobacillus sp. CBA3606 TaxID=2099789 RepID=UPI001F43DD8F|nr:DUF6198 family protein [Lactobacillus sp. CBA3606]
MTNNALRTPYQFILHLIMLLFGLFFMAMGVALSKLAGIGTSPISSIPNVLSLVSHYSIGQMTVVIMIITIILEAVILRHQFAWTNLLQLLPAAFFSALIDYFVRIFGGLPITTYPRQLIVSFISILILALGVYLEVNAGLIVMPGEGIVVAIVLVTHQPFAKLKVDCDIAMVLIAVIIALIFLHGLIGVREGTVLAALLTGRFVALIAKLVSRFKLN